MEKSYSAQELLILFSSLPTILPFLSGVLHYHRLNQQMKIIMWFSLVTFVVGAWSAILWASSQPNLFIGHFYTVIQFVILVRLYQLEFRKTGRTRWMTVLMISFVLLSALNTLYLQPITVFNSNATVASSVILIFIAVLFFMQAISQPKVYRIEKNPMFWFTSGMLLYFLCSLFIFAVSNAFLPIEHKDLSIPTWLLHNIFMWLFFLLAAISLWITPLPPK